MPRFCHIISTACDSINLPFTLYDSNICSPYHSIFLPKRAESFLLAGIWEGAGKSSAPRRGKRARPRPGLSRPAPQSKGSPPWGASLYVVCCCDRVACIATQPTTIRWVLLPRTPRLRPWLPSPASTELQLRRRNRRIPRGIRRPMSWRHHSR